MRTFIFLFLFLIPVCSSAQNIQLHYDFGQPENGPRHDYLVSTIEMFHPDSLGSTFFFVDFEYNSPDNPRGVSLGYFEISREFSMPWFKNNKVLNPLAFHFEYNDGSAIYKADSITMGTNLRSSWLGGVGYPIVKGNFFLEPIFVYKYTRSSSSPDFQFTLVWGKNLFHNKITLSGFIDIWSDDDLYGNPDNKLLIVYSEPQLWFNLFRKFSVGSECKISKNFVLGSNRVEVFPTLGIKWKL